jgi:hypothetical protein
VSPVRKKPSSSKASLRRGIDRTMTLSNDGGGGQGNEKDWTTC